MKDFFVFAFIAGLTSVVLAQQPTTPPKTAASRPSSSASADSDSALKNMFNAKIKVEWDAIKNKDKKSYGELLADDYQGVEIDGQGERTRIQALNELPDTNVFNYTLWGLKVISLGPDAAFVVYESTIQFPPRSAIRYSRVYIGELWMKRAGQWKLVHYQETHVK
ncbi:MAG: nuclear transport factor 2 family protein [Candidatus Sulfotelmatobacter sp.]